MNYVSSLRPWAQSWQSKIVALALWQSKKFFLSILLDDGTAANEFAGTNTKRDVASSAPFLKNLSLFHSRSMSDNAPLFFGSSTRTLSFAVVQIQRKVQDQFVINRAIQNKGINIWRDMYRQSAYSMHYIPDWCSSNVVRRYPGHPGVKMTVRVFFHRTELIEMHHVRRGEVSIIQ